MAPMRSGGSSLIESSDQGYGGGGGYEPSRGGYESTEGGGYESSSRSDAYDSTPRRGVQVAALPDVSEPAPRDTYQSDTRRHRIGDTYRDSAPTPRQSYDADASAPDRASTQGGETVRVERGDTLFGLARKHKVSVNELISLNGLQGQSLKPGQTLVLPANAEADPPARQVADTRAAEPDAPPRETASAAPRPGWEGSHTLTKGESLYGIARRYNVKITDLQDANGISNPRLVRPGTVLRVPGGGTTSPATASASESSSAPPPADGTRIVKTTTQPVILNSTEQKVAALSSDTVSDATPAAPAAASETPSSTGAAVEPKTEATVPPLSSSSMKLRWPVRGRVVNAYGQRPDGTHNDGIDIAVPMGTEVHAAEGGVVAYAGNELEGYGNLVLVRHDNGWVTAYGNNEELLVKRGDTVTRGQIVAKAGKSGGATQPQLHFEVRQDSKPVDPTPFMDAG